MPPPSRTLNMAQTLIDQDHFYKLTFVDETSLNAESFDLFSHAKPLGIAPGFNSHGKLIALAIADNKNCIIIEFPPPPRPQRGQSRSSQNNGSTSPSRNTDGLKALETKVLLRDCGKLYAFDAAPLAMALYIERQLQVTLLVDIQSAASDVEDRKPLRVIKALLGDEIPIFEKNITRIFEKSVYERRRDRDLGIPAQELSQRAWISQFLVGESNGAESFDKVSDIDTTKLTPEQMTMVSKIGNDTLRLDQTKPTTTSHQFTVNGRDEEGIRLKSTVYKTKFRSDQLVKMTVQSSSGSTYVERGQLGAVAGKTGFLNSEGITEEKKILSVTSIGQDGPTTAERQRNATILKILQGTSDLLHNSPWITAIWYPEEGKPMSWPKHFSEPAFDPPTPPSPSEEPMKLLELNSSQQDAVNTMLSDDDDHRLAIVQGPPGTGKTSVIAAFVQFSTMMGNNGIWLVAQSNVAVKNIALKLLKIGFTQWVILVSKDFHFDWHEHLYHELPAKNTIRSDYFVKCPPADYKHAKVMLCTLSMLSNQRIGKFVRHNPLKTLIVDEASQIQIGDYIPVFSKYPTLRKACFIGDDKQLPPFGQEELEDLQSIFEVSHLDKGRLFLDTQYRMPPQIGQIISEAVYESKLHSDPKHPITDQVKACRFIDAQGTEQKRGDSYMNANEIEAVISLARKFQEQKKNYQIITPYDGQRNSIEQKMKEEGLDWANKCFNVDSFQGNEEDYIIISLVRSRELGFLVNLRRTNVMLTRCKKGQYIVTSKLFLTKKGATTLVGTLLEKTGPEAWLEMKDIEAGNF